MPSVNVESMPEDSGGSPAGPVTSATDRLLATVATFDDASLRTPSLCPSWTRAHVLAHLARNADALTNLLTWARTGDETPMYPSAEARGADIDAGARQGVNDLADDLRMSADRFSRAVMDMPDDGWERQVRSGPAATGDLLPGRRVLWLRLRELEIHHVDLNAGYGPADWPDAFVRRALDEAVRSFGRRDDVPPLIVKANGNAEHLGTGARTTVAGPAADVLGWLTGRSTGAELRVQPSGPLPTMPAWL